MTNLIKFSNTLKSLIKERGTTIKNLSEATGIPISTLSEWCSDRVPRFTPEILKLAAFFNVSLEYMITGAHPKEAHFKTTLDPNGEQLIDIHIHVKNTNKNRH